MSESHAGEQLVYLRAQQGVQEMVKGPEYAPGDKIPSERALSEQFGMSRMTMRKAIDNLVNDGVLERRGTSGTFVAMPHVQRSVDQHATTGISEMVSRGGAHAGSRLLFFESAQANELVAARLKLVTGAPLILIRRLRTADEVPFCIETSYLPAERVPNLVAADLIEHGSLYGLLKSRYGIEVGHSGGIIGVSLSTLQEADLLQLAPDSPVMTYRSVVLDQHGRPVEYVTSVNHPQRVVFKIVDGSRPGYVNDLQHESFPGDRAHLQERKR